jgi:phospholipid/cholesterol/gamma-HCH transport system substrate-binding protein
MPRTRSLAWSELKIGVLTIAAIAIAAMLIFSLTGSRGFFWQRYSLKTRFPNVAGLASGSPVRVAGVEVGSVTGVDFAGEQVDVTFQVRTNMRDRITDRSVARLGSVSLLGESAVDITPATSGTPIPEWGYVPPGRAPSALSDMTDQASQGIAELTAVIQDVRTGRGTVGKLMTDEQLYTELRRFVTAAGDLTQGLQQGRGTVGRLLNDRRTADALEASLNNIETMTRQINAGEGSLGKLLKDDAFSRSLTAATTNLDTVVARLNKGEGTMGKLLTDDTLSNQLNSVTARLDQLTASLNAGEGTAGQLLKDRQLYENMNKVVANINSLIANIEKDPRRYLNIRVSIF